MCKVMLWLLSELYDTERSYSRFFDSQLSKYSKGSDPQLHPLFTGRRGLTECTAAHDACKFNDAASRHLFFNAACRYLVEAPPNICTPTHIANAAAKIAEGAPDVMKLEVLEKEDCEKLKMGCFLAVAACSEEPLKFIDTARLTHNRGSH